MPAGGVRLNSGPEKGVKYAKTIEKEKLQEALRQRLNEIVSENFDGIMNAQVDLANGVIIGEKDFNGEIKKIYQEKPDHNAAKNLIDQTIGKAKETTEITGGIKIDLDIL